MQWSPLTETSYTARSESAVTYAVVCSNHAVYLRCSLFANEFSYLDKTFEPTRIQEMQLWREATTIFMAAGHGGCSGQGLALAATRRGFPC